MSALWVATLDGRAMQAPTAQAEALALARRLRTVEQRLRGVEGHRPRAVELRRTKAKGGTTSWTTIAPDTPE